MIKHNCRIPVVFVREGYGLEHLQREIAGAIEPQLANAWVALRCGTEAMPKGADQIAAKNAIAVADAAIKGYVAGRPTAYRTAAIGLGIGSKKCLVIDSRVEEVFA